MSRRRRRRKNWIRFPVTPALAKKIGTATREALNGVVDVSDKFSKTDIGHFVLFMVAWKIIGQKALAVVVGLPLFIAGVGVWFLVMRRFMLPYRVLIKEDKATKTKEWAVQQFKFQSGDAKGIVGGAFVFVIVGWCIVWILVIFV